MVLRHDTLSHRGLQVYQVSLKNLLRFSSYRADTICNGQTDGRTDGRIDIIMFCHIKSKMMSIHRKDVKDYHYWIGTYIIRKWGNRMKRKYIINYIYTSKQNIEIVSGSVNIQNDLIYFSLPSNDTFLFHLDHEVSPYMLGFQTYGFPNIQGFLKYEYNI